MTSFGKVFIFEENTQHLDKYIQDLEQSGFATFGTDNLYLLMKYAKEVQPDIVIMNLPTSVQTDDATWKFLEENLCRNNQCPEVYINTNRPTLNAPNIHYYNFNSDEVGENEIFRILEQGRKHHYLH